MAFQPSENDIVSCHTLLQALSDPVRNDHRSALESLGFFISSVGSVSDNVILNQTHNFITIILYIFVNGSSLQIDLSIRQLAGLIIKNYIINIITKLPVEIIHQIKGQVLNALGDNETDIRSTAGTIIGRIADAYIINEWIDLIPPLIQMLDFNDNIAMLDGALVAIKRMAEDSANKISMSIDQIPSLQQLLPKLISLFHFTSGDNIFVRKRALECVNSLIFLFSTSQSFLSHVPQLLLGLGQLASDSNPIIRKTVCQSITLLLTHLEYSLELENGNILSFMVTVLSDANDEVIYEGAEFWISILELIESELIEGRSKYHGLLQSYLHLLIPSIIKNLILTQQQIDQERVDEIAEHTGEKQSFIPRHHNQDRGQSSKDEAEVSSTYTLRKQCAFLLDNLSNVFDPSITIPITMPVILTLLQTRDNEWYQECGLLALGAISKGCAESEQLIAYLPQLFNFFVSSISGNVPEIRAISCWTIGRYAYFLFEDTAADVVNKDNLISAVMQSILNAMQDTSPRVQHAACSALCSLIEYGGDSIIPYVSHILTQINQVHTLYGVKNTLALFDVLGTLATEVGDVLGQSSYTQLYMPFLMKYFYFLTDKSNTNDNNINYRIIPLLETLSSIAAVIGMEIVPFASEIFNKCLYIAQIVINSNKNAVQKNMNEVVTDPDENEIIATAYLSCALDVISGLCEGLQDNFFHLVQSTSQEAILISILFLTLSDNKPENDPIVLQSAFSLAGEICKSSIILLLRNPMYIEQILKLIEINILNNNPNVSANAIWTLGELALKVGGTVIEPHMNSLFIKLQTCLHESVQDNLSQGLRINVALTLGRLAITNGHHMANKVSEIFADWCEISHCIDSYDDKMDVFRGMMNIITITPTILFDISSESNRYIQAYHFIHACSKWIDPPDDPLLTEICNILAVIKSNTSCTNTMYCTRGLMTWENMVGSIEISDDKYNFTSMFRIN